MTAAEAIFVGVGRTDTRRADDRRTRIFEDERYLNWLDTQTQEKQKSRLSTPLLGIPRSVTPAHDTNPLP